MICGVHILSSNGGKLNIKHYCLRRFIIDSVIFSMDFCTHTTVVQTATDKGISLNNLSPFAIHKGVKSIIAGGDVTIKYQFNGGIYLINMW